MSRHAKVPGRVGRGFAAAVAVLGLFAAGGALAEHVAHGGGGHAAGRGASHGGGAHAAAPRGAVRGAPAGGYARPHGAPAGHPASHYSAAAAAHYSSYPHGTGGASGYRGGYGGYGGHAGYGYGGGRGWHGGGGYWRGRWWGGVYPLGLFFAALPAYYETLWWNGVPYYYANSTFYAWNDGAGQYETVAPPGEDAAGAAPAASGELYVYPQQGQSEEQLRQDRFECHQWAVGQSGFDPTQPNGGVVGGADPGAAAESYRRAEGACLEGRGYTVR